MTGAAGSGGETTSRGYDASPCYPCVDGEIVQGWAALADHLIASDASVVALDGPAAMDWDTVLDSLVSQLRGRRAVEVVDVRDCMVSWERVVERTAPAERLVGDEHFLTLARGDLADLFDDLPVLARDGAHIRLAFGPGAALIEHDVLWYVDVAKRFAEAAVAAGAGLNLGQRAGEKAGTASRLFYIDWPLLDRHRDRIATRVDRWVDVQSIDQPASVSGSTLRASMGALAQRPFRTRPTFNTTSWGGHWAQDVLGVNQQARNTALGYELIAPESGVLLGTSGGAQVEVPFQLLVALHPEVVMGGSVTQTFGTSFPVRFDYLDTVGGGNLSVHCHPTRADMSAVFGWPYTQHESYYMMVGGENSVVYLGLKDDVDLAAFHRSAHDADSVGTAFDIEQFVQTFPADPHQLFMIPAGTPHGSGAGNVVLEVSATPYLYSLRFYDWLRRDADGTQRPVHVDHAFRNLDRERNGKAVAQELVQPPQVVERGAGWKRELIGSLPEVFFDVERLTLDAGSVAPQDTDGRFHILNLVDGQSVVIRPSGVDTPAHSLAYAETIVVPAAVGPYEIVTAGSSGARLVRAHVR